VGSHPNKWDNTGRVVEVRQHDQYVIRMDGSSRVTLRNRRFLRKYTPFQQRPPTKTMLDLLPHITPAEPVHKEQIAHHRLSSHPTTDVPNPSAPLPPEPPTLPMPQPTPANHQDGQMPRNPPDPPRRSCRPRRPPTWHSDFVMN
jgi:hypothetical protein